MEREDLPGLQVDGIERIKAVLQLHAIGADVLHRRRADGAGNQSQVFQPRVTLCQRPGHQFVPALARTGLHDEGFVGLHQQPSAHEFNLEHQCFDIAGEHNIAATAQHKFGTGTQLGVGQQRVQIRLAGNAHQRMRLGHDVKAIESLQGNIFLD